MRPVSTANGQLDAELEREASVIGLPNYCVVLVCGDETNVSAHGSCPSSGRSITPDAWFSVVSTGKHVTALVAMDLLQQKGVPPDRPIGDLLGGLPEYATRVSVGSLANHVSGLPEYLSYEEGEVPPDTRDGFRRQLEALEPVFQEGQSWMYSNSNFILIFS